jgi:hypothetical protein
MAKRFDFLFPPFSFVEIVAADSAILPSSFLPFVLDPDESDETAAIARTLPLTFATPRDFPCFRLVGVSIDIVASASLPPSLAPSSNFFRQLF